MRREAQDYLLLHLDQYYQLVLLLLFDREARCYLEVLLHLLAQDYLLALQVPLLLEYLLHLLAQDYLLLRQARCPLEVLLHLLVQDYLLAL